MASLTFDDVLSGAEIALIQNVLNRVMLAMDSGDGREFASCYTPDGTCDIIISGAHHEGAEQLEALGRFLHDKFRTCRHWEGNVCVSKSEDAGCLINKSYWKALDGGEIVSTGIHEDKLVTIDGKWLIRSRVVRHTWTKSGGHISI